MPALTLIAVLIFNTPFQCIQHLDSKITHKHKHANVTYLSMHSTIMELYGGHAILRCDGEMYSAYILEDK